MSQQQGAVEAQRLFFALRPEPVLQQRLAELAKALLPFGQAHLVRPENLHCTLMFIGAVEEAKRFCLEDAASLVRTRPFTLTFDRLGYFRQPQAAWLGCTSTPAALQSLVKDLQRGAEACGFTPETRPYTVHLTVARKLRKDPGRLPFMAISWPVNQFVLMESCNEPDGIRYRPLRYWDL